MFKFKVGDIVILVESQLRPEDIGKETEIVGVGVINNWGLPMDYAIRGGQIEDHPTSGHWCVSEYQLRKKRPPQEDAAEWFNKNIEVRQPERV